MPIDWGLQGVGNGYVVGFMKVLRVNFKGIAFLFFAIPLFFS